MSSDGYVPVVDDGTGLRGKRQRATARDVFTMLLLPDSSGHDRGHADGPLPPAMQVWPRDHANTELQQLGLDAINLRQVVDVDP